MLRFSATNFINATGSVEHLRVQMFHEVGVESRQKLGPALDRLTTQITELPLSNTLKRQVQRIADKCRDSDVSKSELIGNLHDLWTDVQYELAEHVFLCVPAAYRPMYLAPKRWFGEEVVSAFPEAYLEFRDCGQCLALEQWTASVFHAMRIMEHGLRRLAARVGSSLSQQLQVEQWHTIIENIESRLREMKREPKARRDDAEIELCSKAASHFFATKEAWRNHVSHVRGRYDEKEATKIVYNVRDFMRALVQ